LSNARLREAVLEEEQTIKALTRWLVRLTWGFVGLLQAIIVGLQVYREFHR
jgi:hypothetical protein